MLLVSSLSVMGCAVKISRATTTVYINPDGSIFPVTAPITSSDNVTYIVIGDMLDSNIEILRDNIVFNGNNHTLQGSINVNGRVGVIVENLMVSAASRQLSA